MAITQCEFDLKLKVTETIALGVDQLTDQPYVTQIATDTSSGTKTPTTAVPVTQQWQDTISLTAGAATVNLAALTYGNLAAKDFTGLKVQGIKIRNRSTNSAYLNIAAGATNGYNIFGANAGTPGSVNLPVGMTIMLFADTTEGLDDIAAADRTIDFASSDTDLTFDIQIVAG